MYFEFCVILFDIWFPRNVSEACYSVCRLPEDHCDQCVLTSCVHDFVTTQFSNEFTQRQQKKKHSFTDHVSVELMLFGLSLLGL